MDDDVEKYHQHTSTPAHQHTSTPAHQHTSTPAHQHTSTPAHQHTDVIGDAQVKKLPYSPPTLSILEPDEIAGGTQHLQEADGTGFVS